MESPVDRQRNSLPRFCLNPVNGIVNPAFWIAWESKNRQQAIGVRFGEMLVFV